jgi:hypothetical protein
MTAHRWRAAEAAMALVCARVLLRAVPFRWVARIAGAVSNGPAPDRTSRPASDPAAAAIGRAVAGAARRLPWRSTCLDRALAGRLLLARRGIPSTLVLGVAKDQDLVHAHAWLVAGGGTVSGRRQAAHFNPIAAFRTPGRGPSVDR